MVHTPAALTAPPIGEPNGPHNPTLEPGKAAFLNSVEAGLSSATDTLGTISCDYGYGGEWHETASELDKYELVELALVAYYDYIGALPWASWLIAQEARWLVGGATSGRSGQRVPPAFYPDRLADQLDGLRRWTLDAHAWSERTSTLEADVYAEACGLDRSAGQSLVTALLVQDRFGGHIVSVELKRPANGYGYHTWRRHVSTHHYNVVGGYVVDLTRDQYRDYSPLAAPVVCDRAELLADEANAARYAALLEDITEYGD